MKISRYNFKNFKKESNNFIVSNHTDNVDLQQARYDVEVRETTDRAFNDGYDAAKREIEEKLSSKYNEQLKDLEESNIRLTEGLLEKIKNEIQNAINAQYQNDEKCYEYVTTLSLLIGEKIAECKLSSGEKLLITNFIKDHLKSAEDKQQIILTLNDKTCDIITESKILDDFEVDVQLVSDSSLEQNDCKLEWTGGGIHVLQKEKIQRIVEIFTQYYNDFLKQEVNLVAAE